MKLLIDTHLVLWAAGAPERLPPAASKLMGDADNTLCYSAASLWEVAIKAGLGRDDFKVDAALLRRGLNENGWLEVPVTGKHAIGVATLPTLHKDPFDRMLVAQCQAEGLLLLTSDETVSAYPGAIQLV